MSYSPRSASTAASHFSESGLIGHHYIDFVKRQPHLTSIACFSALLVEIAGQQAPFGRMKTGIAPVPAKRLVWSPCHPCKRSDLPEEISFRLSRGSNHVYA